MLPVTTLRITIFLSVVMVVYCDSSTCDPETQYLKDGLCCQMCGPGTRMISDNPGCQDPQCKPCLENEYQPAYTKETRCFLHPYCDPNKSFESKRNLTSLSECRCKEGYHCNNVDCLVCVPHSECRPGWRVASRGTHNHDTNCQACPSNTFSNESGANECIKHTVCKVIEKEGTDKSDAICVPGFSPGTIILIISALAIPVLAVLFGFIFWKRAPEATKNKVKEFFSCLKSNEPTQDKTPRNVEEVGNLIDPVDETITVPDTEIQLIESMPVENEEVRLNGTESLDWTEGGNHVAQEVGKGQIVTHPESQLNSLISIA